MMNFSFWKLRIAECIQEVGDLDYQRRAWRAEIPGICTSFTELMCNLYDDFDFRGFLVQLKEKGQWELFWELDRFNTILRQFREQYPDIDDEDVLVHPDWHRISREAKRILPLFHESVEGSADGLPTFDTET